MAQQEVVPPREETRGRVGVGRGERRARKIEELAPEVVAKSAEA